MKNVRVTKKRSLFDVLKTEVRHDLSFIQSPYSRISEVGVVYYTDSRTGREAYMSAGRWYATHTLLSGLQKRYIGPTWSDSAVSSEERERRAVVEFLQDNERCRLYNEHFNPETWPDLVQVIRGEVKQLLWDELSKENNALTASRIGAGLASGPGSSSGLSDYDAGSYSRLGNSPMTFSSETAMKAYKSLSRTSRLSATTEAVRTAIYGDLDSVDVPAIFLSVPKTNKINRGICTQPSGNMACQLSTHKWLSEVLLTWGVDLSVQQFLNRDLALYGSRGPLHCAFRSWTFCTFDLSRASNFPWILIADLFPPEVVSWLDLIRSHYMQIPVKDKDGNPVCVPKHMCSTMGNGFTFALMTLLLSAIVRSLYAYFGLPEYDDVCLPRAGKTTPEGIKNTRLKTWAVYGDDIIVDRRLRFALPLVLQHFGFLVNVGKSYSDGLFRESCGADFYDGYNVRPVFVESLDNQSDIYSLLNRLLKWSSYHSIPLPRTCQCLRLAARSLGPELRVPSDEDVSAGLQVPPQMAYTVDWFKKNLPTVAAMPHLIGELRAHGCMPYVSAIPKGQSRRIFLEKARKRWYCDVVTREKKYFTDVIEVRWNTEKHPNLYAVLQHMLSGEIRQGQYGVRPRATSYEAVWRATPNWGVLPDPGVTAFGLRAEYTTSYTQYYNAWLLASLQRRKDAS